MVTTIKKGTKPEKLNSQLSKAMEGTGVDTRKYCGVIKLKEDALKIQKQLRNEWK
jgi:hypothetical protein